MTAPPFLRFLDLGRERGGFETDDVLAAVLPLMREVAALHDLGRVAPLRGLSALAVLDDRALGLAASAGLEPASNAGRVHELQKPASRGVEVIGELRRESDEDFHGKVSNLDVAAAEEEIARPVYLAGYTGWEHAIGHHDALTDIHSLGLLLASLACGLDFTDRDELERFANHRRNLFALAPRLHPVVAGVVVETTELHRGKRAQDLPSLIRRLETYRDQPVEEDVLALPGLATATKGGRRRIIQTHLRDRLFEVSRRNRLLYFQASQATLNLTTASVPLVLDYRNIRPEQLFYWHDGLAAEIIAGRALPLQRWLRHEEAPYLPGQLDRLISDARRSRAEYGFSQLRLVIAFLRWNNLKEAPQERIHSPLLLLPVELVKKKGVKDHYTLESSSGDAEVNPALRHHLKQLYDLDLPATLDLRETSLAAFHDSLCQAIRRTEPGVVLEIADKPKIQLVHERARQRLDQYRRRMARQGRRVRRGGRPDHSYESDDFRPLGLQLFQQWVVPSPLPLRGLAGAPPRPRTPFAAGEERKMFALVEEAQGNPYAWELDLCALTLANFNYRKMTLVRDYANLIEHDTPSQAFDRIFSIEPRAVDAAPPPELPPSDQHLIIAADATQVGAIARARQGDSLIIQGPPGTGKSQTITNLIADYVARGKRVLFVCEKRAAIDVVFHRLRQQGLDELCCLIHDSQTDKKEFILNLKQTYEQWLADAPPHDDSKRVAALRAMESELAALEKYAAWMAAQPAAAGTTVDGLLRRLIELRGTHDGSACPDLSAEQQERLPDHATWRQHGDVVVRLGEVLADLGAGPAFARHPLRWLGESVIVQDRPLDGLAARLDESESALDDLDDPLRQTGLPSEHWNSLEEIGRLLGFAQRLLPLARRGLLDLLDPAGARAGAFSRLAAEHEAKRRDLEAKREKTVHWIDKLPPDDTAAALALAPRVRGLLGFLNPARWRLAKVLRTRYDSTRHAVAPSWEQILTDLSAEHAAAAALADLRARCLLEYASEEPGALAADLATLMDPAAPPAVKALRERLLSSAQGAELVETLAGLAAGFERLERDLRELLDGSAGRGPAALAAAIRELREELDSLPELLPALRELAAAPEALRRAVRELPITPEQLEAACARKTLEGLYHEDRMLQRFDCHLLQQKLDRLANAHRQWLDHNASWIRAAVRGRFLDHIRVANLSATALSQEQKAFKKSYTAGRRELEHEFGKTMRYKSIRDLAAGDSGEVVRDLKPIWLMSPLSVSDTLPLDPALFDVVIFDEASQIPVEDAVPAAYRAPQVIVVGDEMQLPPTRFFSATGGEDDEVTVDEEGESVTVLMDADSFLTQSARNLPSTLLAWHYRSRYESLISFSNAAFYGGELYTIPDRQLAVAAGELVLARPDDAAALVPEILSRPISYLRCEQACYEDRRNSTEAAAVARLVRGLLAAETRHSIGIAAFSEAQQGEIEGALESLAAEDPDFAARLEAEYVREEDDQFCGLFVKNLENVQGDERDIILMSVCYAPDAAGRMRMNFGPINQRGGEKRLNVIFSRARHHMVLVGSIRHHQITNDYNDGARALRDFLHYADSLSRGDAAMARQILDGLNPLQRKGLSRTGGTNAAAAGQIAGALRTRGWLADLDAGQSRFRCDVAVRAPGADRHQLAVLVESGGSHGVLERFHTRPGILRAFGWQVAIVTLKDWWHDPAAVLERIERLLRREIAETLEEEIPAAAVPQDPQPAAPVAAEDGPRHHFEFTAGNSRKFWAVSRQGASLQIRFGRIGTSGQLQVKSFADDARAAREMEKLIAEKTAKGYVRTD
jgi:predicted DNA-binding WGR domain protein